MKIKTLIKGLLLTSCALAVFCLNVNYTTTYNLSPQSGIPNEGQPTTYKVSYELGINNAYAQSTTPATTPATNTPKSDSESQKVLSEKTIQDIAEKSNLIFRVFHPAIYVLTKHINNLMGTDLIFGGAMGEMLHRIWVVSRNIVNIAFVLILLFMAVRQIFWSDDNADLKKLLPKFALMLIVVNFSWLATRLVIDAANVATNVMFQIPAGVQGLQTTPTTTPATGTPTSGSTSGTSGTGSEEKCPISDDGSKITGYGCGPTEIHYPFDAERQLNLTAKECLEGSTKTVKVGDSSVALSKGVKEGYADAYGSKNTDPNFVGPPRPPNPKSPFYQTAIFCWDKLDMANYDKTNAAYHLTYSMAQLQNLPKSQTGDSILKVGIGTIFALFITVVYLVSFLALFVALIFRVAILWILVGFSPFLVLLLFMKMANVNSKSDYSSQALELFTQYAFAPAKVAAIWAVGFIMITIGQTKVTNVTDNLGNEYNVSSLFMNMNSLQEIIWLIMTIIIIWMGTFAVLTQLKGAQGIIGWINDTGKKVGGVIAKSPTALPLIPSITTDKLTGETKLDFKNRKRLRDYDPNRWAQNVLTGGDTGTASQHAKAEKEMINANPSNLLNAENSGNSKEAFQEFQKATGNNYKVENVRRFEPKSLEQLLMKNSKISADKAAKLAPLIIAGAKNASTKTYQEASAPAPKEVQKPLSPAVIEKGVTNALNNANLKASQADIKASVSALKDTDAFKNETDKDKKWGMIVKHLKDEGKTTPLSSATGGSTRTTTPPPQQPGAADPQG